MKPRICIRLFDRLAVHCGDRELLLPPSLDAREILSYLIVNRRASVPRETLATLISPNSRTERSRKALRQALWRLRDSLSTDRYECASRVLSFGNGWVQFTPDTDVWVDVDAFEQALSRSPRDGPPVSPEPGRLSRAVDLYKGDLLQGWDQQWCLEERERLRQMFFETLDLLIAHCISSGDVNAGVGYANRALRSDPARECTHRALMCLYVLAGDRAAAIHQYERCVEALRDDLGMEPDEETQELEREIRAGRRGFRSAIARRL